MPTEPSKEAIQAIVEYRHTERGIAEGNAIKTARIAEEDLRIALPIERERFFKEFKKSLIEDGSWAAGQELAKVTVFSYLTPSAKRILQAALDDIEADWGSDG